MTLLENYHTHTARCGHATGEDRAYVEAAIQAGIRVLGFSDHTPYPFDNGFVSGIRMSTAQTEDYVRAVLALREEYRGQIDIKLGFEAEYFPHLFGKLLQHLAPYPVDYLLLGQHFSEDESQGIYFGQATNDHTRLVQYVDQVLQGLSTGCFSYLAHPDLIHLPTDTALYRAEMRRLCEGAKAYGVPLECNLLGLREHRHYPCDDFFAIAAEVGNEVVLGMDAHQPGALLNTDQIAAGCAFLARHGITPVSHLRLKPLPKCL